MTRPTVGLLLTLALSLLVAPLAAHAQPATKVPQIGILWPIADDPILEAFRQGLRDLGYVEGQNIVVEYCYAEGQDTLLPELAAELVRLNVDVIVTWGWSPPALPGTRPRRFPSSTAP